MLQPFSLLLALLMASACSHGSKSEQVQPSACPDPTLGEKPEDCPWAALARSWQKLPTSELTLQRATQDAPELFSRILEDATRPAWKSLWGQSFNYDELAKAMIVEPHFLDLLFASLQIPPKQDRIVHAGAEHTYGYLFSLLQTPYGYKRARWVQSDIELGFGLPHGSLSPLPSRGTLLSNLTYFAGRVALHGDSKIARDKLKQLESVIEPGFLTYPWKTLQITRIEETFENLGGDPTEKTAAIITLRTDLVPFPRSDRTKAPNGNSHLLIYSVLDPRLDVGPQLITAFPVNSAFGDRVIQSVRTQPKGEIVIRYNAFVPRDLVANLNAPALPGVGQRRVLKRTLR
jgi:hypothetical protein